jgi:hypothetical protein
LYDIDVIMANDKDLMNTQTGGEGETIQIQTQEKVTPEEFDVNIKTQNIEQPTNEVISQSSQEPPSGIMNQEFFNQQPPLPTNIQEGAPSTVVEPSIVEDDILKYSNLLVPVESLGNTEYEPVEGIDSEDDILRFQDLEDESEFEEKQNYDTFNVSQNGDLIRRKKGSFDSVITNVSEEPYNPNLNRFVEFQKRYGLGEYQEQEIDKKKSFFDDSEGIDVDAKSGLDVDSESLNRNGIDNIIGTNTLTTQERVEMGKESEAQELERIKEESLNQYNSILEQKSALQAEREQAQQEEDRKIRKSKISDLNKQIKSLDKVLNSLEQKEEVKEYNKQVKNISKKKLEGLCMDPNALNYMSPGACILPDKTEKKDYTYYPDKWMVLDLFDTKSNKLAKRVFKDRIEFDGDNQVGTRYGDKIQSSNDAQIAVLRLFAKEDDIEWYKAKKGMTRDQAIAAHTQSIISQYNLKAEELIEIDKLLRESVNWARSDQGKYTSGPNKGKFKAALLPNWGLLPKTTVEVEDRNGNLKTVTVFGGIQENEEQKKQNKNGYGISPWNKESFQYKEREITSTKDDPYHVPALTLNYWEKNGITLMENGKTVKPLGDKFNKSIFKQQKMLLRNKDANGEPYLKGDDPIWGVGLTGRMDDATSDALRRFNEDKRIKSRQEKMPLSILTGIVIGKGGESYQVDKDNPFYIFYNTGKMPNVSFGGKKMSEIPFSSFKNLNEAELWASRNLPNNVKKVTGLTTDILDQDQNDFKKYIEKLGIGVTVKPIGRTVLTGGDEDLYERATMFDLDRVILKAPKGVIAQDLEIDLGEDDDKNEDRVEKLQNWLNAVQESPYTKFVDMWSQVYDPANYIGRFSQVQIDRGNSLLFSAVTDQNKFVNVSYGKWDMDKSLRSQEKTFNYGDFTKYVEGEQQRLGTDIQNLIKQKEQYEKATAPQIQELERVKKDAQEKKKKLSEDLAKLDSDFDKGLIKEDEFNRAYNELSTKYAEVSTNLNNAIKNVNSSFENNKETYDNIVNLQDQIEEKRARITGIGKDLEQTYTSAVIDIKNNVYGPSTVVGSLASSFVEGIGKSVASTINLMMDLEKSLGIISETDQETIDRKNKIYNDDVRDFLDFFDLTQSQSYKENKATVEQILSGVTETMGGIVNPITRVTKGTPLEKVGQIMGFATVSYADIDKEVSSNPELAKLSEFEKKMITLPYAIGMGVMEDLGYGKILRGDKSSIANKVLTGIIGNALKSLPKNATLEGIEKLIKGEVSNKFLNYFSKVANAAGTEAEAEAISTLALDIGFKNLVDNMHNVDVFNQNSTWPDYLKMVAESYVGGAIGGSAMSGTFNAVNLFSNNKIQDIDPKEYDFFRLTANDENLKKIYQENLANQVLQGKITNEEAQNQVTKLEEFSALDKKISNEIVGEDRVKMADLLTKKQKLEEEQSQLDKSQSQLPNPALDQVNNDIDGIVNSTLEKIKTQEKNVEENKSRVSSEVGEGQEPIETQPITETSQEEISPSGMVQEEQTEVTPTEEIVTEETITPTAEVTTEAPITNEFDELAEINKMTSPTKKNKAMKAFNEKYGEKATRISEIDSKFTSIVNKLESQNIIKKKC